MIAGSPAAVEKGVGPAVVAVGAAAGAGGGKRKLAGCPRCWKGMEGGGKEPFPAASLPWPCPLLALRRPGVTGAGEEGSRGGLPGPAPELPRTGVLRAELLATEENLRSESKASSATPCWKAALVAALPPADADADAAAAAVVAMVLRMEAAPSDALRRRAGLLEACSCCCSAALAEVRFLEEEEEGWLGESQPLLLLTLVAMSLADFCWCSCWCWCCEGDSPSPPPPPPPPPALMPEMLPGAEESWCPGSALSSGDCTDSFPAGLLELLPVTLLSERTEGREAGMGAGVGLCVDVDVDVCGPVSTVSRGCAAAGGCPGVREL